MTLALPYEGNVVGEIEYVHPEAGETLAELGVRFDIGYEEMVRANPKVDKDMPLPSQGLIRIPSQFVLPNAPRHGLVINLAEYRLYFFPEDENVVMTYPVGIGRKGWETPLGVTQVIAKQINPIWHPTGKLLLEAEKKGVMMPDAFPPGAGNPLGKYVLRLGWPAYLIHGASRPEGVGVRVSAGCIRMLPSDIEYLFGFVKVGTAVHVINELAVSSG